MADYPQFIQPGQDPASKIAAATSGLIGGINEYSRYQTEKQLATQKMQAGLLSQGLIADEEGNVQRGPVAQAQYKQQQDEMDPASETSRHFREYGKGMIGKTGLDPSFIQDPDETGKGGTSAYTIKQYIQEAKPAISGEYGLLGKKITGGIMGQRLGIQQGNQAVKAADTFDKDHIITALQTQQNQIQRDKHTLDNAKVLTPQIFEEIQLGLGNAISGGKSAAVSTEEKVAYKNAEIGLARVKQMIGSGVADVGSPEVRKLLSDTFDRLGEAYQKNMQARAHQLASGREGAYSSNPAALKVMHDKEDSYGKGLIKQESEQFPADVTNYAKTHGITPEQAAAVKKARTGQ